MPYTVYYHDQHICFACIKHMFDTIDDPTLFILTLQINHVPAGSKCQKCGKLCDSDDSLVAIEEIKDLLA